MSSIVNVLSCTIFACARNAGGTMLRASSLLSTSTTIHALCTPSLHPHSVRLKKWDPVLRKTWTARAHAVGVPSCGTSMRNLVVVSISPLLQPRPFPSYCSVAGLSGCSCEIAFARMKSSSYLISGCPIRRRARVHALVTPLRNWICTYALSLFWFTTFLELN